MNQERCRGRKADGSRCQSPFVQENGFCVAHGPGAAERMKERAQRGGEATKRRHAGNGLPSSMLGALETIQDAQRWLRLIAQAVGEREITYSEGQSMTGAVREWVKAEGERLKAEDLESIRKELAEFKRKRLKAL